MHQTMRVERIVGALKHPWLETEPTYLKGKLMQHLSQELIVECTDTSV